MIQRYRHTCGPNGPTPGSWEGHNSGEWVKWEDVYELLIDRQEEARASASLERCSVYYDFDRCALIDDATGEVLYTDEQKYDL